VALTPSRTLPDRRSAAAGTPGGAAVERLLGRPALREVVPRDPATSLRWQVHGYPDLLARWNVHPEVEIHLIRRGTGRYLIGDVGGAFGPGHLALIGPNLPHDWISDLPAGTRIPERDVVIHFDERWLRQCQVAIPELRPLDRLLHRAAHGVEYFGATARDAAEAMERIGVTSGAERVAHIFTLLHLLHDAPEGDFKLLVPDWTGEIADPAAARLVGEAIEYIFANIGSEVRLSKAARLAGMSDSAFSRYFKAASGQTFSDMVARLRLEHACRLLASTTMPIAIVAREAGFANLSNFNRRFRAAHGMTPRVYRAAAA